MFRGVNGNPDDVATRSPNAIDFVLVVLAEVVENARHGWTDPLSTRESVTMMTVAILCILFVSDILDQNLSGKRSK